MPGRTFNSSKMLNTSLSLFQLAQYDYLESICSFRYYYGLAIVTLRFSMWGYRSIVVATVVEFLCYYHYLSMFFFSKSTQVFNKPIDRIIQYHFIKLP